MLTTFDPSHLLNALLFAVLGIVILILSFVVVDKLTPYDLWKEIVEEQNVALAIMVGAMSLALGVIIAAAVH